MRTNDPVGAASAWGRFWFTPADPIALHAVRVAAGMLLLAWLLPLAAHRDALFGLGGWFDRQAFAEAATLPGGPPRPLGWSALYAGGGGPGVVAAVYFGAVAAVALFTLGVWVRLTVVLTWVAVASLTAHPAVDADADPLLLVLTLYLMVGYLMHPQPAGGSRVARLLGGRSCWGFGSVAAPAEPSVGAGVALRLLQVHLAVVIVTSGLHKLQFGDWWAGVALWYPLYPPLETSLAAARAHAVHPERHLMLLNVAAYGALAWQIAFPAFAWLRAGWWLVLGGAAVGWAGAALVYRIPLYGPAVLVGGLAFVPPEAWRLVVRVAGGWVMCFRRADDLVSSARQPTTAGGLP